jgi:hypothetical protein
LLDFTTAEILRFAQNDSLEAFFRSLLARQQNERTELLRMQEDE